MPRPSVKVDGGKIRELRQEKAMLEQQELAAIIGVRVPTLWRIELGNQTTSPTTLRKIAKALRVRPAELLRDVGSHAGVEHIEHSGTGG